MSFMVTIEHGILNGDTEIKNVAFEYVADYKFPSFLDLVLLPQEILGKKFEYIRGNVHLDYGMEKEREDWLKANVNGDCVVCLNHFRIYFNNIQDAVHYRLRW